MVRIAVDMDEVIADALSEHISRYNNAFNTELEHAHFQGKRFKDAIPHEHREKSDRLVHTRDFFADLKVMPGAQEVLRRLCDDHEVFIATAAMEVPLSFDAKYQWLLTHFPFISPMNFVFCGDKSIICADYLIDDNARQLERFAGTGILFDAPHNRDITGYQRVRNWFEVNELFSRQLIAV
jgi:5'(3')-deoxyribonucleotidase